ncbi:MAG TPA: LPS export ABC transporter periplasmic protein LptC [Candidatus Egerieousia sp.]|nr:LPS export ABC transporter periplasmic protein LptC [Candidatus Egerieousia sp.]HPT05544.1 LPS export ABC transporter periplasmic protein LptC [Candidatus Egerieousia sp.]
MQRASLHIKSNKTAAIKLLIAAAFVLSCVLVACERKTQTTKSVDLNKAPRQIVDSIYAVQTENGGLTMRVEAKKMEKYENDTISYELFPMGFDIYSYNRDGFLETHIHAKAAKHTVSKTYKETWAAYGNVEIFNYVKGEKMVTDTLYWDKNNHRIYTHCFVKMSSPRGLMQGYGMESDEMARNADIMMPFDSYSRLGKDSILNRLYKDTANFIGPVLKPAKKQNNLLVKGKEKK